MSAREDEARALTAEGLEHEDDLPDDDTDETESRVRFARALVAFRIGAVWLGIDASLVSEISDCTELTWLPRAPPHILGLMNLAGYPVPIMDLRLFLQLPEQQASVEEQFFERIVVASADGMRVGLRADQVMGVLEAHSAVLEPLQITQSKRIGELALGELKGPQGVVTVLDFRRLLEGARVQ